MTLALTLNIALSAVVLLAIVGRLAWAIATQERDRGVTLARRPRPVRASQRPAYESITRRGQAWPAQ